MVHLLRFWKMDPSLLGAMQTMAVTCSDSLAVRDQLRGVHQIQATGGAFAVAAILEDGSGVMQTMVVTVRQFEISSRVCSRFRPQNWPLLPFW